MNARFTRGVVLVASLSGCSYAYVAPRPAPARAPVAVRATTDQTWAAALEVLGESHLPVASADRAAGVIVTQSFVVARPTSVAWSDCGRLKGSTAERDRGYATRGELRVTVTPSGQTSAVRVVAAWAKPDMYADRAECVTTGAYEGALEDRIRATAEGAGR